MHRFCSLPLLSRRLCKTKNYRLVGRSKPRPYSAYFQHETSQKTPFGRRVAPWCDRVGVWMPIAFSSLVPRASYLSYLLPLTSHLIPSLSPRCKLGPLPCRRYGSSGCAGGTAIMGNAGHEPILPSSHSALCHQDASLESLRYSVNPTLPLAARWGRDAPQHPAMS